jgi:Xaa-Pro aminopeptidase
MTIANYLSMCSVFGEDVLLFDNRLSELLSSMRRYKSREELRVMQQAQDIADRAFARILDFIREGVTEREISLELTRLKYLDGASGDSFENIVASGANSAVPHATPSDKPVAKGDFVTMDFGAVLDGYASDMTRTVAIGEADEEKRAVYDTVLKAQRAAFDVIAPGVPCKAVDAAARELNNAAGYEGCFGHGLGHSLGLQVHEEPRFSPMDTSVCEPGLVMSVEPGVYLEGRFGCRIEDVVCITEQGFVNLARSPKELLVL